MRVTAHASIGVAKASPVSTATGSVSRVSGEWTAPNAAATARKIAQFMVSRRVQNRMCPWKMSAGRSGEAAAA